MKTISEILHHVPEFTQILAAFEQQQAPSAEEEPEQLQREEQQRQNETSREHLPLISSKEIETYPPQETQKPFNILELYEHHDATIKKVPKYIIGDGVLGRAFVDHNYIEILDTLTGTDYERVLAHELYHVHHPGASEYETREMTNTLYFTPNPYLSTT